MKTKETWIWEKTGASAEEAAVAPVDTGEAGLTAVEAVSKPIDGVDVVLKEPGLGQSRLNE